jgi:hypothetical protein
VQEYNEECIASNYEKYIAFPAAVVEILESEVPALLAPFFD